MRWSDWRALSAPLAFALVVGAALTCFMAASKHWGVWAEAGSALVLCGSLAALVRVVTVRARPAVIRLDWHAFERDFWQHVTDRSAGIVGSRGAHDPLLEGE